MMDFIEPLLMDNDKDCILTITDCLFSGICLIPCWLDLTVEELAGLFFEYWYCENGLPLNIVSDHNKLFLWYFWKMLNNLTGVKLKISTYHPQTDRSSECSNKTVDQPIWYFMQSNQTGWVKALPIICFNIMNTINSSTNLSGFQLCLVHSQWIILPIAPLQLVDTETLTFPMSMFLKNFKDLVVEAKDSSYRWRLTNLILLLHHKERRLNMLLVTL